MYRCSASVPKNYVLVLTFQHNFDAQNKPQINDLMYVKEFTYYLMHDHIISDVKCSHQVPKYNAKSQHKCRCVWCVESLTPTPLRLQKRININEFDKTNAIIGIHTEFASNLNIQFQEIQQLKNRLK
jgi:hypothetical protein